MAFLAWNLFHNVWRELGKIAPMDTFAATGGGTTSVVNNLWQYRDSQPDDNYSLDYTAIVTYDAGGAAAAPEGEMQRISAYDSATWTHTTGTFSAAVAASDRVALANADITLPEMYELANRALMDIGDLPVTDSSLTTASDQTEYTLPVALKRRDLLRVQYQGETGDSDNNEWVTVSNWEVTPSAPGSTGLLILPQLSAGNTIKITYWGVHPALTAYNSVVSEYIHPKLATLALCVIAQRYLLNAGQGGSDWDKQRYNELLQEYENAKVLYPIWRPRNSAKWNTIVED